ncbi:MAG: DUF1684 domain-containing protein [Balneolaceae bacterium]
MKARFLISLFILVACTTMYSQAQTKVELIASIQHYQDSLDTDFRNPELSPLTEIDFKNFKGLDFYPIDLDYYIKAKFVRTPNEPPFAMPTTTPREEPAMYEKYGEVHFTLNGESVELPVYQSHSLREEPEWENYLFLPFKDATNGKLTYGGGRYLELWMDGADTIIVDFNKAYNPYCAFNIKYSCPIVPKENRMNIAIYAGEKNFIGEDLGY